MVTTYQPSARNKVLYQGSLGRLFFPLLIHCVGKLPATLTCPFVELEWFVLHTDLKKGILCITMQLEVNDEEVGKEKLSDRNVCSSSLLSTKHENYFITIKALFCIRQGVPFYHME